MGNRFLPWVSVGLCLYGAAGFAAKKPRIGVVAIQDRRSHALGNSALDGRLLSLVKGAGYDGVPLRFQPAADVEHQARLAGCVYILYTDVVDVQLTAGSQVAKKMPGARKRDIWEAEIEFRIFAVDQVQPLLSTSVTGRNAKSRPAQTGPAAGSAAAQPPSTTLSAAEPNVLTDATPREESGRQRKHKSVAVAAALEREVKMVRERLSHKVPAAVSQ